LNESNRIMDFFRCFLAVAALFGIAESGSHISGTIVETAVANGNFGTLAAALTKADLVDTLNGAGPFTVFAPTDAAFANLLSALGATAEQLLERPDLTAILTYHVAAGKVMSTGLSNGMSITTLQGASAAVGISGSTVKINEATVTSADIECTNGVIHVIDQVLMPPSIVDIAVGGGSFSTLVAALTKANLVDTLKGAGPFTVFAPTDTAFTNLLTDLGATAEQLLERADLADILKYHVASGKVMSTDLSDGMEVATLQGSKAVVRISGQTVKVGDATVAAADIVASNGVVHVIDKVLMPPAQPADSEASGACGAAVGGMRLFIALALTCLFIASPIFS